jgi:hypothetical protein
MADNNTQPQTGNVVTPPNPNLPVGDPEMYWSLPGTTTPGKGKPPANAVFWTRIKYADGRIELSQHDPKTNAWKVVSTVQPKSDDVQAKRYQDQVDNYQNYLTKAAPQVTQTADPTERYITVQQINPQTGQLEFKQVDNPGYDPDAANAKQAATKAQIGSYEAASARGKIETEKMTREERERGQQREGGLTGLTNVEAIEASRQAARDEWQRSIDRNKADLEARKITFDQAVARLNADHARIGLQLQADQNKLTQRSQDITVRGQNINAATEVARLQTAMLPYYSDPGAKRNIEESIKGMAQPGYKPQYGGHEGIKLPDARALVADALAGMSNYAPQGQVSLTSPGAIPSDQMPTYGPAGGNTGLPAEGALQPDFASYIAPQPVMPQGRIDQYLGA